MIRLLQKLRSGCKYKIQTHKRRGYMLLSLVGTKLMKLMSSRSKKRCVIQPSNYPISIFKELYERKSESKVPYFIATK